MSLLLVFLVFCSLPGAAYTLKIAPFLSPSFIPGKAGNGRIREGERKGDIFSVYNVVGAGGH